MKIVGDITRGVPPLPVYATELPVGTKLRERGGSELFIVIDWPTNNARVIALASGMVSAARMEHYDIIPPGSEFTVRV